MYVMFRSDRKMKAIIVRADRYVDYDNIETVTDGALTMHSVLSYFSLFLDVYKDYDSLYDIPLNALGYLESMFRALKNDGINEIRKRKHPTKTLEFLSFVGFMVDIGYSSMYSADSIEDLMKFAEGYDVFVLG